MISIASSRIDIIQRPKTYSVDAGARRLFKMQTPLEAIASVVFDGAAGETPSGWTVGWMQAQWIETNWGVYRGASQADGSIFVQRARPPARPHQACLDTLDPTKQWCFPVGLGGPLQSGGASYPFTTMLPKSPTYPLTVDVKHFDAPGEAYELLRQNSLTKAPNMLRAVQIEFAFCTLLVVRGPDGRARQLRGFYWNVHWQQTFDRGGTLGLARATDVPGGNISHVGHMFAGSPNDPRFAAVLNTSQAMTCNQVAQSAALHPNVREVAGWPNFDVRR